MLGWMICSTCPALDLARTALLNLVQMHLPGWREYRRCSGLQARFRIRERERDENCLHIVVLEPIWYASLPPTPRPVAEGGLSGPYESNDVCPPRGRRLAASLSSSVRAGLYCTLSAMRLAIRALEAPKSRCLYTPIASIHKLNLRDHTRKPVSTSASTPKAIMPSYIVSSVVIRTLILWPVLIKSPSGYPQRWCYRRASGSIEAEGQGPGRRDQARVYANQGLLVSIGASNSVPYVKLTRANLGSPTPRIRFRL